MKFSPLALLALALGAGLTLAPAQDSRRTVTPTSSAPQPVQDVPLAPGSDDARPEDTLLGANYRIVISATANGTKMGELAALTCTSPFQMAGYLVRPTAEDEFGASLAVRGALAEMENGTLKLSYAMRMNAPVPMQTWSSPGAGPQGHSTYSLKKTGASGMLRLKPGQSCEVMQISGIVYSLSITPTETPPAAAPADAKNQSDKEPGVKKTSEAARRGHSAEDRERYEKLSEWGREKFRESMRANFASFEFRNSPEDERRAQIRKLFDQVLAEDLARNK